MHEYGLTERLLEVALAKARAAGAERISALHIALGRDAGVAAAALRFYWPMVRADTPAAGARLVIRRVAGDAVRLRAIDVPEPADALDGRPMAAATATERG